MRAFLGVPVPAFEGLKQLASGLRESGADLKIVEPDRYHLTIKFFGEVAPERAEIFANGLQAESLPAAFDIAVRDVGAFPNWKTFHTLWAGIEDPTGGLTRLFEAAEKAWLAVGGMPEDRPFSPHLTLARSRSDRGLDSAKAVLTEHRGLAFGTALIDHANLYKSTLTPAGPVYEVVREVKL